MKIDVQTELLNHTYIVCYGTYLRFKLIIASL